MYILKGLSCCVLQAALLPGETNCTHEDHLSSLNRCPTAAQAKCLRDLDCIVGVRLGALTSHTLVHKGLAISQLEKLVSLVLVHGPAAGGLA